MADGETVDLRTEGLPEAALGDGALASGSFDGETLVLLREAGEVRAFSGQCTHLQAPLAKGLLHDGKLRCPFHHARFCARSGAAVGAPAFRPLTRYQVEIREGRIFVAGPLRADPPTPAALGGPILVIGTGAAGFACAAELARRGAGARVTVIGMETERPYERTFASKQVLAGKAPREKAFAPMEGVLEARGVTLRLGAEVEAIDRSRRDVVLTGGERLTYETLVLATGAEPVRPDIDGLPEGKAFVLRTLADADAIAAAADSAKAVAILGASFIALEAAAALRQRGLEVTVVAPTDVPLARVLGEEIGRTVRTVHEDKGVAFRLGRKAARHADGHLVLDDGSSVAADFVVAGIGVNPRTALAEAAGLALAAKEDGGGVRVDARLTTDDPAILAVGDIASYPDRFSGRNQRIEHWVHAGRQGEHAARVILGETEPFADLPYFWTAHFDFGMRYVGHAGALAEVSFDGDPHARNFAATLHGEDRDRALVTAKRDPLALATEAAWEAEA